MRTPAGLASQLAELNTRRLRGELDRNQVIARALEWATENDPSLMMAIHEEWFSQRVDASLARMKKDAAERGHQIVTTGEYQAGFDEICPSYLLGVRAFGTTPTLEDAWTYHKQQCQMTANFAAIDGERETWLREADAAVSNDRSVLLEAAARARLEMLGEGEEDDAAEG